MINETPMGTLAPVIGMLASAAITPGPNNVVVMEAGARGVTAAGLAILGVVSGSVVLLGLVLFGMSAVTFPPFLRVALSVAGGAYLIWLGLAVAWQRGEASTHRSSKALPATVPAIAAFQLVNPKAWVLVMTAASMMPPGRELTLALLMVLVTCICLAVWASAGAAIGSMLQRPAHRIAFNRVMGASLAISAAGGVTHALAA